MIKKYSNEAKSMMNREYERALPRREEQKDVEFLM